jgi:transcriptional regulator with XRE-family HTH domain
MTLGLCKVGIVSTSTASDRYVALVFQMGDEWDRAWGWKSKAARKLGVHQTYISAIANGDRTTVGSKAVESAIDRLGLDPDFFYGEFAEPPHYTAFLPDASVERPEPYAALEEFLKGPEGQAATPEEIEDLRAIRWRKQPTVLTYRFALQAVRAQVELTPEEIELNASLRASVIAKGGRIREG